MQPNSAGFHSDKGTSRDAFGCHNHGLAEDLHFAGGHIDFFRKASPAGAPGLVATPASDRGFLLGLSLAGGHRRRIFAEHHSSLHDFDENCVYLRRFDDAYKADLEGSFDFILMEVSSSSLGHLADEAEARGVTELRQTLAEPDPLLGGLLRSLFSTVGPKAGLKAMPQNRMLADELCAAVSIHLVHHYGNGRFGETDCRRRLSSQEEKRSKDMLDASISEGFGIDDLAAETGLSPRVFMDAFRETTGERPHHWVAGRMIERAKSLLRKAGMSPTEVGRLCGFGNIVEFAQAFRAATGLTPADWQRASRS
jgi:AraC-like DNA-binding protein